MSDTHVGYYAEVNLTLAYERYSGYTTCTSVDRTGWPDCGEWFDTYEAAKKFVDREFADMVSYERLEDGYRITPLVSRLDSVEYVVGTIERDELDEDDNPIENGEVLYELDSRPDYVIKAMEKVEYYDELADRIAQERGEGWKIVTDCDYDHYYTSQTQVDMEIYKCGYKVIRTADETELHATIHVTYCE